MALRAVAISTKSGISAAVLVAALILAAVGAVLWRAEFGSGLGPADWSAIRFTVLQAALSALLSTMLAIPVARALARRRFVGRGLLVTLLGAPFILPVIVAVLGVLAVFGRAGWLNAVLAAVGLPGITIYGLHGVVLAHVFFNLPLATRLLLQAWQTVPAERFRLAAQLDLTPRAVFRSIELPLLRQILPDHTGFVDLWQIHQRLLDRCRHHVASARRFEDILDASGQTQKPLLINLTNISGMQEALFIQHLGGTRRLLEVAHHQRFAAHQNLTLLTESALDTRIGQADISGLGAAGPAQMGIAAVFGHAIALDNDQTETGKPLLHRRRQAGRTADCITNLIQS